MLDWLTSGRLYYDIDFIEKREGRKGKTNH